MRMARSGKVLYLVGVNGVTMFDTSNNTLARFIPLPTADSIAVTPDGRTAYVSTQVGTDVNNAFAIYPINLVSGTVGAPIKAGGWQPVSMAITPNGKTVYVVYQGEGVTPINTATNAPGPQILVTGSPFGIAITPNGKTAYVTSDSGNVGTGVITPIRVVTNTPERAISLGTLLPASITVALDGKTAYVSGYGGVIPINISTNRAGPPIGYDYGDHTVDSIAITPDSRIIYVANQPANDISVFHLRS